MARRRPNPKKLLVASVGVATLNYLPTACSSNSTSTVANLMAGPPYSTGGGAGAGIVDSGADAADAKHAGGGTSIPPSPTVANLMAPAPPPQRNQSPSAPKGK